MKELNEAIHIIRGECMYTMSDDLVKAYDLLLIVQERLESLNVTNMYEVEGIKDETLRVDG